MKTQRKDAESAKGYDNNEKNIKCYESLRSLRLRAFALDFMTL
jgi:hypothetical protein